jgi:hypothetical protein
MRSNSKAKDSENKRWLLGGFSDPKISGDRKPEFTIAVSEPKDS